MPNIRRLPSQLVNKIAAGEVVERPASVVKELVENSLDAEATRIEIAVEEGGKRAIRVTDNGIGISADELSLAFAPHSTSKLPGDQALSKISTMGFRGEALASIASISHARMRSRRLDQQSGYEISVSEEDMGQPRPCASPPGTMVEVRDLFFNTPARRKFLRTTNTEFGHVTEQITRLALGNPQVAFVLLHNGRETRNIPRADSTAARVSEVFGSDTGSLLPIVSRGGKIDVSGLIATPSAPRATARWQYFFLNGRYIRDRVCSHALREAYRGLIEGGRFPAAFIFIELDPQEVDVNVHPTKIEVRFRDSQAIHGELLASLTETLNRADLAPSVSLTDTKTDDHASSHGHDAEPTETHRESLRQALADFFKSAPPPKPQLNFPGSPSSPVTSGKAPPLELRPPEPAVGYTPKRDLQVAPRQGHLDRAERLTIQIHNSYIVAACDDGIEIIDQHALHERIIYNDLKRRLAEAKRDRPGLTAQRMLIPETFSVTQAEAASLEANSELLVHLGIEVVPFGPEAVAIQQFPALLAEKGVVASQFVRDLIDRLMEDQPAVAEELLEDILEMMACKAAVKAGDPLNSEEIDSLLDRRDQAEKSSACPHGRPTTLKLTLKDLAKQFKRT